MRTVFLLAFAAPYIFAVDYVTIRSGNWDNTTAGQTPWATGTCAAPVQTAGVTPIGGSGADRVTICNGHTLTVPAGFSASIGDSATPTTFGLQTNGTGGTGVLVVNGSLTVRANVKQGNATWTFNGGGSLTFDNSTAIFWRISDAHSQANALLKFLGTNENRVTVTGNGFGRFQSGNFSDGGLIHAFFTDFHGLGDATNNGFAPNVFSAGKSFIIENSTIDNSAGAAIPVLPANTIHRLRNVRITNSIRIYAWDAGSNVGIGTGERLFENVYFDKRFGNSGPFLRDFTFRNVVFNGGWIANQTQRWALMENVININGIVAHNEVLGSINGCYVLKDINGSTPINNPHFLFYSSVIPIAASVTGCIFESSASDGNGDLFGVIGGPSSPVVITIQNNIGLKDGTTNNDSGGFGTTSQSSNVAIVYNDNTLYTGHQGFAIESNGIAGLITSFRRNLHWDQPPGAARGWKLFSTGGGTAVTDVFTPANGDWNNGFNLRVTGSVQNYANAGNSYDAPWSAVPGTNDLAVDPKFVDTTRRITTWDASLGGTGTYASARARLQGVWDGSVKVVDLLNWVRQGYAPRNLRLANESAGGSGYIGAVKPVLAFGTINAGN